MKAYCAQTSVDGAIGWHEKAIVAGQYLGGLVADGKPRPAGYVAVD